MRAEDRDLFSRSELYRRIGPKLAEELIRDCQVQEVPKGTSFTRQGEMPDYVHVILSGRISLVAKGKDGEETVITTFGAGEMLVTPAAILQLPYLVTSIATTPARVLPIPTGRFRRVLQSEHALALMLVTQLARHWRLLLTQIQELKLSSAGERLIAYLLREARVDAGPASFRLRNKRYVIAAELGMSPESLSRAFKRLRHLGVASRGGAVEIADVALLVAEIGGPVRREPDHETSAANLAPPSVS
jgi:CRP/FNR family transcriptional activator FtrB